MRQMWTIVRHKSPVMLPQTTTVQAACKQMRDRRTGVALVVDTAGALVGIFTGRDAVARVLAEGRSSSTRLSDAMTPVPDTIAPDEPAIEALRMMEDGGYRHLPVVERGRVVGIVSRGDFRPDDEDRLDQETRLRERIW